MTLAPATTAIWTRLHRSTVAIGARIEAALKAQGLPALAWYDALWELEKAETGLRQLALQGRLLLPQYALSRLIDRMDRAGLVGRAVCTEDGRGHLLTLTPAGKALRAQMWQVYQGELHAGIEAKLTPSEAVALASALVPLTGSPPDPDPPA